MKKVHRKKLVVSRLTLRHLGAAQLERAAGGQTLLTCSDLCSQRTCNDTKGRFCDLDTEFVHGCAG